MGEGWEVVEGSAILTDKLNCRRFCVQLSSVASFRGF